MFGSGLSRKFPAEAAELEKQAIACRIKSRPHCEITDRGRSSSTSGLRGRPSLMVGLLIQSDPIGSRRLATIAVLARSLLTM
jgi:hypothetical protein